MSALQLKDGFYKIELNKTIWEVPQRYQLLSPVGAGAYGQVCSALDTQTNIKVAVKKLARPFQSAIHAKRTYREIRMLKHMNHENVIGLLDIFTPTSTLEDFNDVYLVNTLMGADLNNIIKTQRLSDDHVQFLVYQILRGLKYIHSAGIIHRDMKPANIAATADNLLKDLKPSNIAVNEDCELKILDFGLARHTEDQMTGYVATRWYRAPEIVLNWMHYGQTVDIWSVGCIMAEMLTGKALFPGNDHIHQLRLVLTLTGTPPQHLLDKITDEDSPYCFNRDRHIDQLTRVLSLVGTPSQKLLDKISSPEARNYVASMPKWPKKDFREVFIGANPLAIDLMEKMLDLDSETRVTAEDALAHSYLAQYSDPNDEPTAAPFDQSFENMELSIPEWRRNCYEEVQAWNPS